MNVFKYKNVGKIKNVKNVKKRALNKKRKNVFFTSMCANDLATGVGIKHAVSRQRPILGLETVGWIIQVSRPISRPWPSGLDRDRDLDKK